MKNKKIQKTQRIYKTPKHCLDRSNKHIFQVSIKTTEYFWFYEWMKIDFGGFNVKIKSRVVHFLKTFSSK